MNPQQVELFSSSNPFQGFLSQESSKTEKSTSTSSPEEEGSQFLSKSQPQLQLQEDFLKSPKEPISNRPKKRRRRRRRRKIKSIKMHGGGGNGRFDIGSLKVYTPEEFTNMINNRDS